MTTPAKDILFRGALLIDGTGAEPLRDQVVTVAGGRIKSVGPMHRVRSADDVEVVDVEGRTLLPGLIDAHTHLTYHAERPDVWLLEQKESVELNTFFAGRNAARILASGFTSIGDGGCRGFIGPAVRDAVRLGLIPGPDIVAAGPIICGTAGLLDGAPAWAEQRNATSLGMTANGPERVRAAVRRQVKGRVDWIKVATSGVAGSPFSSAQTDDLGFEEIQAAVSEAAKYGKLVHAHAHSRNGILAAVRAGAVSIHCAEYADEECLDAMAARGTIFSPTIAWLHVRCMERFGAPPDPDFRREAWDAFDRSRAMIVEAHRRGLRIAVGSDASHRFPHVPSAILEMEYFEALGYSPLETIRAATETAAAAIGRAGEKGRIAPGHVADLLVVDGNPADGVRLLRDPRRIWRSYCAGRPAEAAEAKVELARKVAEVEFEPRDWLPRGFAELQRAA
jgi:imidazolonepropionase-like amidohydrolase